MLHWPSLSPTSFSNRFPGGTRRNSRVAAPWIWVSLRRATRCMSFGNPVANVPWKIFSVSLRRKVLIMDDCYHDAAVLSSDTKGTLDHETFKFLPFPSLRGAPQPRAERGGTKQSHGLSNGYGIASSAFGLLAMTNRVFFKGLYLSLRAKRSNLINHHDQRDCHGA